MINQSEVRANRAFEEMRTAAVARLHGRRPEDISQKSHIPFDAERSVFSLTSLGVPMEIDHPLYRIQPSIQEWHHLVLLHYMDLADGTPLSQQWKPLGELKDGMVRGGGFDRECESRIQTRLGYCTQEQLVSICRSLGAEIVPDRADVCAIFPFFPQYPVMLKIWLADDELPGSGRMLVNGSTDHYLTIEDAVTVGGLLLDALTARCAQPGDR